MRVGAADRAMLDCHGESQAVVAVSPSVQPA